MTYPGAESRRKNKALSAGWSEPTIAHRPTNVVQEEWAHFPGHAAGTPGQERQLVRRWPPLEPPRRTNGGLGRQGLPEATWFLVDGDYPAVLFQSNL